jgi:2-dehydropantoate 2-reductase
MVEILIAGSGSIGTVLGIMMQNHGYNTILLRKSEPTGIVEISVVGLLNFKIDMQIRVKQDIIGRKFDYIFITVQNQQTLQLIDDLNEIGIMGKETIIVVLQNGLDTARPFILQFPDNMIIQGAVWWSATMVNSTKVLYHRSAPTILGIPDGSVADENSLEQLSQILSKLLEVQISQNIKREMRKKLILNVVSPVLAMIKEPYPQGLNNLDARELIRILFEEAIVIAKEMNWDVVDDKLTNFHKLLQSKDLIDEQVIPNLPRHKVSTELSLEKYGGRESNAFALLHTFVDNGAKSIEIVLNRVLTLEPNYEKLDNNEIRAILEQVKQQ